jgi:hypothetical protein
MIEKPNNKISQAMSFSLFLVETEIDWMACSKVAFDNFRTNNSEVINVFKSEDSKTCNQLCKPPAKTYYFNGDYCKCFSRSFSDITKQIKKLGAPKGCSLPILQGFCVSITFFNF